MTPGLTLCRRARRAPRYQAVLRDLAGIEPAEHLRPTPIELGKQERHRAQSQGFRLTGEVQQPVAC